MRKFLLSFLATLVVFPALAESGSFDVTTSSLGLSGSSYIKAYMKDDTSGIEITGRAQLYSNYIALQANGGHLCVTANPNGKTITKIVINAKSNGTKTTEYTVYKNSSAYQTNGNSNLPNLSGTSVSTVTLTNADFKTESTEINDLYFGINNSTNGNQILVSGITVFWEDAQDDRAETSIAFEKEDYTLTLGVDTNIGAVFDPVWTMTPAGQDFGPIDYESSNPAVAIANENNFIIKGSGTTELTVSYAGDDNFKSCSATCTLTVIDPEAIKRFELVTSTDEINIGDRVVIVNSKTDPYAVQRTPITGSNAQLTGTNEGIEVIDDHTLKVDTEKAAMFTIVQGKTNMALQYPDGRYLTLATANAQGFNSTTDATNSNADVIITQGNTYITIKFTNQSNYVIKKTKATTDLNKFRAYADANGDIFLYKIPVEKQDVTLSWSCEEYSYDMDFGSQDELPVLAVVEPEGIELSNLNVEYSSSNTEVATISNGAATKGKITAKGEGETTITAEVSSADKKYKSEPVSYTLKIAGAPLPQFVNSDDEPLETNEAVLLPSEFEAGYIVNVKKAGEDYGVKVSVSPSAAGTVEQSEDGAQVKVTGECTITAQTTKGEQVSTRKATFEVKAKVLPQAEISWSAPSYVYDLASNSWNNTPQLTNTNGYPVVYNSSDPDVATVSEKGKITPGKQGTTIISATVEGTDNYAGNTVTTRIRVTDSTAPAGYDIFEMVQKGDQLRENEQFIIVSGEPFNPEAAVGDYTKVGGMYYALTPSQHPNKYYEAVPIEFPEGDESGERLMVKDDVNVLRLNKQYDTSISDTNYPYLFQVMNDDPEIQGKYIQVDGAKLFSFVDLPENIEDRGKMNGNIRVLDPEEITDPQYKEVDYINIYISEKGGLKSDEGEFINKGEILFNNSSPQEPEQYFVRFNPTGSAIHFNVYKLDNAYDQEKRSKSGTYPIRIYRRVDRVEKPSITVYPEEPVSSDIAYEGGQTYNNKVRVVIEQHPKTTENAKLMRQWQAKGKNPALPDYEAFKENQITVFVDGNEVVDENDQHIRYIDGTRTLFAVANFEDVYSESASATFNFKTAAPRITNPSKDSGQITVRIARPANYTKDAIYYYVISTDNTKPSVTFNQDGSISATNGNAIDVWTGTEEDTNGTLTFNEGETLWVGSFKSGYEPTLVEYNNLTAFPECRPMQLLRLTDKGREFIIDQFDVESDIFDSHYDPECPLYINYRNDLVNEDGTFADNDYHYHYLIQRDHSYGATENRKVWIEQISEEHFRHLFGNNPLKVDEEHAQNFEWTSDYYVFALNEDEFKESFNTTEKITVERPIIVTNDRTYTALDNVFLRKPVNSDGSFDYSKDEQAPTYYGAFVENMGKLGAKTLTTKLTYYVGEGETKKKFTTEATAEVAPRIPSAYGFTYEYQYEQEGPNRPNDQYWYDDEDDDSVKGSLTEANPGKTFVKLSVPSAIDGMPNQEALIPIEKLNSRHLNLIFKFHRPNISKHILEKYDIYYNIKFNRVDETDPENPVKTLLAGSGVYIDTETEEGEDAVYRFRIDDVNPTAAIYPEIEISKVTFVGNSGTESYGQYGSNFGKLETLAPLSNNAERTPMNVSDLELVMVPESVKEVDGKKYADWKYIGHSDLYYDPDIVVNNEHTGNSITLSSSFFHLETYLRGTDYYNSYEYLVEHAGRFNPHIGPQDYSHYYYHDEEYGSPAGRGYDSFRHTIIARDVPEDEDGNLVPPTVVMSPVYFFAYGADMKPLNIGDDDNIIDNTNFINAGGHAQIVKVNDLPGAVSPTETETEASRAPRRSEAEKGDAPKFTEYPMPHTGDTDMTHESILDLSSDPNYTVVYGGKYDSSIFDDFIVTGAKSVLDWNLHNGSYSSFDPTDLALNNVRYLVKSDQNDLVKFTCPSAKKLKVRFAVNNHYQWDDNATQELLIEQNSFSMIMYPGFNSGVIQIIPIAESYNDEGELYEKDHAYTEKRFAATIALDESGFRTKEYLLDYTTVGAEGSIEGSTDVRYSINNDMIKAVISKDGEQGKLAISEEGKGIIIAGGNEENDWAPINYNMEFSFTDEKEAAEEHWAITSVEMAATNPLNMSESYKDFTLTGNVWMDAPYMSDPDGLRFTFGWVGYNPDIHFSASAAYEALIPEIKVTISYPAIPKPVWVIDQEASDNDPDYIIGTLMNVNGKNHEIYYMIKEYSHNAPQKGIYYYDEDMDEDNETTQIKKQGSKISTDPVIKIKRNSDSSLRAFAEHPKGLKSDIQYMNNQGEFSELVTEVDNIITDGDGDGEERYYNLQGVEVKNPSEGVYIRVKNGRSEKVLLK